MSTAPAAQFGWEWDLPTHFTHIQVSGRLVYQLQSSEFHGTHRSADCRGAKAVSTAPAAQFPWEWDLPTHFLHKLAVGRLSFTNCNQASFNARTAQLIAPEPKVCQLSELPNLGGNRTCQRVFTTNASVGTLVYQTNNQLDYFRPTHGCGSIGELRSGYIHTSQCLTQVDCAHTG